MADLDLSRQYLYNGVRYGPGPMSSDDEELVGALVARETNGEAENAQRKALMEQYGPAVGDHNYIHNFGSLAPIESSGAEDEGDEPKSEPQDEDEDEDEAGEFDTDPNSPTFGERVKA